MTAAPIIVEGRVPPHDLDAEAAVLSAIMVDPAALPRVLAFLRPEHFYSEAHRRIYEAALDLHSRGQPVDVVQVGSWLKSRERIQQVGGMGYLTEILNAAPAVANVAAYGKTIHEKARVRSLILLCQRIAAQGYLDYGDAGAFIQRAEQAVFAIGRESTDRPRFTPLFDATKAVAKKWYDAWSSGDTTALCVPTGFRAVDDTIGGLFPGELHVVGARPGMGKSSYVLAIVQNVAMVEKVDPKTKKPIIDPETKLPVRPFASALASLEMPNEQIGARALCAWAEVDLRKARSARFDNHDWQRMVNATQLPECLASKQVFICGQPGIGLAELRGMLLETISELDAAGLKLVVAVVDYLQLMKSEGENQERRVANLSKGLKQLAMELQICVVALSSLNRGPEARDDKRPLMSDLRDSGNVESDADIVKLLYRDEYYDPDSKDRGIVEVIVAKGRNAQTGTVKLGFMAPYTKFFNLPPGEPEPGGEWQQGYDR